MKSQNWLVHEKTRFCLLAPHLQSDSKTSTWGELSQTVSLSVFWLPKSLNWRWINNGQKYEDTCRPQRWNDCHLLESVQRNMNRLLLLRGDGVNPWAQSCTYLVVLDVEDWAADLVCVNVNVWNVTHKPGCQTACTAARESSSILSAVRMMTTLKHICPLEKFSPSKRTYLWAADTSSVPLNKETLLIAKQIKNKQADWNNGWGWLHAPRYFTGWHKLRSFVLHFLLL